MISVLLQRYPENYLESRLGNTSQTGLGDGPTAEPGPAGGGPGPG
jgi:hypothetical protein